GTGGREFKSRRSDQQNQILKWMVNLKIVPEKAFGTTLGRWVSNFFRLAPHRAHHSLRTIRRALQVRGGVELGDVFGQRLDDNMEGDVVVFCRSRSLRIAAWSHPCARPLLVLRHRARPVVSGGGSQARQSEGQRACVGQVEAHFPPGHTGFCRTRFDMLTKHRHRVPSRKQVARWRLLPQTSGGSFCPPGSGAQAIALRPDGLLPQSSPESGSYCTRAHCRGG